jgi:hypothetical protein
VYGREGDYARAQFAVTNLFLPSRHPRVMFVHVTSEVSFISGALFVKKFVTSAQRKCGISHSR